MSAPVPDRSRNPFVSATYRHRETPGFFAARGRNLGVGAALLGFVGAVFVYSMRSVSQDDFAGFDKDGIRVQQPEEKR